MARIHARRKGRSGSKRPYVTKNPEWVPLSADEIVDIIVEKAKKGVPPSQIGLILRDQYGVPSVKLATGKSMLDILREHDLAPKIPEDMMSLMKQAVRIHAHLLENPKDIHNKRNLSLTEAKIRRLERYYKRTGVLPSDWKYTLKEAELLVS